MKYYPRKFWGMAPIHEDFLTIISQLLTIIRKKWQNCELRTSSPCGYSC